MRGSYGRDRLYRNKGGTLMVARVYYPGMKCSDCGVDWGDRPRNWARGRCAPCYQKSIRIEAPTLSRPYSIRAPTEKQYRARIRKIADVNVPEELRQAFLNTFLNTHNPYKERSL
jgi:hypothetical protein